MTKKHKSPSKSNSHTLHYNTLDLDVYTRVLKIMLDNVWCEVVQFEASTDLVLFHQSDTYKKEASDFTPFMVNAKPIALLYCMARNSLLNTAYEGAPTLAKVEAYINAILMLHKQQRPNTKVFEAYQIKVDRLFRICEQEV